MMKKKIIFIFLIAIAMTGNAQVNPGFGFFTDRDVYVGGEMLLAKIYTSEENASKVVYLDLVNRFGNRVSGVSLQIQNNQADGYLHLPDSLSSGTYQLRAYQKNSNGKLKIIREIWISNRFDGLEKTNPMKRVVVSDFRQDKRTDQIDIVDVKPEYPVSSPFDASLRIDEQLLKQMDGNLLVSVAQTEKAFEPRNYKVQSDRDKEGMNEEKGIILSGTITDKKTSQPVDGITVYLTIPDSVPGFQYYKTMNDGRFYFLIENYYGSVQAFVQCFGNSPAQRLKIKMDDQYAESTSLPEFTDQVVPEQFKSNIKRNIDAVTLQKIFSQDKLKLLASPIKKRDAYPYYGKPSQTVDPQLFVDLPDFNEVSKELLPGVKFRNYNNEPTLQVMNAAIRNFFAEKPLILIDGIPIQDLNVIKGMGSADIDRIDICQSERFYGDLRFAGVVAIYTTNADYSKLPDSDQLVRLKLETIQTPATLAEPQITGPNIPDLRQVIYWNPSVQPQAMLSVKCKTSSVLGEYRLVVRGRFKDGTLFYSDKQFEVK